MLIILRNNEFQRCRYCTNTFTIIIEESIFEHYKKKQFRLVYI